MTLKTVLLIDDNESEQFLYKAIIKALDPDIEIISAYDGVEGLELLETMKEKPDCILLDINMPRMNGLEFLEEYSKNYKDDPIIITMLTSSIHDKDKEQALAYDCVRDFFMKPLAHENIKKLYTYLEESKA